MSNPYSSPENVDDLSTPTEVTDDHPIRFEGQIELSQVRRLFQAGGWLWTFVLCLTVFLLLGGETIYQAFRTQDFWILSASIIVAAGLVRLLYESVWNRMGPGLGKRLRDAFPESFEYKVGQLSQHWLSIRSPNKESHFLRQSIANVISDKQTLWLLFDASGNDSQFFVPEHFPEGNFESFKTAIMEDIGNNKRAGMSTWTDAEASQLENVLQRQWPAQGILVEGVITRRDFMLPGIRRRLREMLIKLFLSSLFWIICFAAASYVISFDSPFAALAIMTASGLMLGFYTWRKAATTGWWVPNDKPVMAYRLLLWESGIAAASRLATTDANWSNYQGYDLWNDVLAIRLRGTAEVFLIIPQRLFASEADWQAAQRLVANHLPRLEDLGS